MRRLLWTLLILSLAAIAVGLWLTAPQRLPKNAFAGITGDAAAGEQVFWAAGCASCHSAPESKDETKLVLAGGRQFPSDFGTFVAPNISPDPQAGIGSWSLQDFANAVTKGVSPEGAHYYPAFPYTAYSLMELQDVADLWAFWQTLPGDPTPSAAHDIGFPFSIRRSLGGWKLLFGTPQWTAAESVDETLTHGRYLVEALGHCAECHSPRNALGGLDRSRWMGGAPNPAGKGNIPNLTPAALKWSEADIAYYLETGFTPDFDSVGSHMVAVVENFAKLAPEDRAAVAAYLKSLPPVEPQTGTNAQ